VQPRDSRMRVLWSGGGRHLDRRWRRYITPKLMRLAREESHRAAASSHSPLASDITSSMSMPCTQPVFCPSGPCHYLLPHILRISTDCAEPWSCLLNLLQKETYAYVALQDSSAASNLPSLPLQHFQFCNALHVPQQEMDPPPPNTPHPTHTQFSQPIGSHQK